MTINWKELFAALAYLVLYAFVVYLLIEVYEAYPDAYILGSLFLALLAVLLVILLGSLRLDVSTAMRWAINLVAAVLLLTWYFGTALLAERCFYCAEPDRFPRVPLGVAIAVVLGLILFARPTFHRLLGLTPVYWLVLFLFARIVGVSILVEMVDGVYPAVWAIPLGGGDLLLSFFAPWLAYGLAAEKAGVRRLAVWWCVLGLLQVTYVIVFAALDQTSRIQVIFTDPDVDAVTHFPAAMDPLFGIPILFLVTAFALRKLARPESTNEEKDYVT